MENEIEDKHIAEIAEMAAGMIKDELTEKTGYYWVFDREKLIRNIILAINVSK